MNLFKLRSDISIFENYPQFSLYCKNEYKSFGSFGVKLRKFEGLLNYLDENKISDVLIYGNPHSNFVSTYSTLLKFAKKTVHAIHYTKDPKLITANSILSKSQADTLINSSSKNNREFYISEFKQKFPTGFLIPEFGIHKASLESLKSLWKEISDFEFLFLDLGTGFTALSAADFFAESKVKIYGVCIGNDIQNMKKNLLDTSDQLGLDKKNINRIELIPCIISKSFGSSNAELNTWIEKVFYEKKIPLEPVYSGKSLFTIHHFLKKNKLSGKGIYIHQGGLLNSVEKLLKR
jgi:1-aminocyclopropane-1-carboxylate deaminase